MFKEGNLSQGGHVRGRSCPTPTPMCVYPAVTEQVNTQLMSRDAGRLFAVVHVAGKQRKVTAEDIIILDKHIAADIGQRIRLNKVTHTLAALC